MTIPVEDNILTERIEEKLKNHDKSIFTQAEVTYLRNAVGLKYRMDNLFNGKEKL